MLFDRSSVERIDEDSLNPTKSRIKPFPTPPLDPSSPTSIRSNAWNATAAKLRSTIKEERRRSDEEGWVRRGVERPAEYRMQGMRDERGGDAGERMKIG